MNKHQNGFGLVGILLVVLVVGVLGFVGWRIYDAAVQKPQAAVSNTSANSPAPAAKADPYKGWKTYTLKYEKFSFKYPDTFTLADTSTTDPDKYIEPGMDNIRLTKPNGLELRIDTGLDGIGGACEDCRVLSTQQIRFLGQTASLNYVDNDKSGTISGITVTKKNDDWFGAGLLGKNIKFASDGKVLPMGIYVHYIVNGELVHKDLAALKASEDIKDTLMILDSASY